MFSKMVVVVLVAASLGFSMSKQRQIYFKNALDKAIEVDKAKKLCTEKELVDGYIVSRTTNILTRSQIDFAKKCLPESYKVMVQILKEY